MDAVDSWVAGCEWALGELLGQVYGKEYPAKYDPAFQKFSLQGGMGAGEVRLEVLGRHRNVTCHPELDPVYLWPLMKFTPGTSLCVSLLLVKPLPWPHGAFQVNRICCRICGTLH